MSLGQLPFCLFSFASQIIPRKGLRKWLQEYVAFQENNYENGRGDIAIQENVSKQGCGAFAMQGHDIAITQRKSIMQRPMSPKNTSPKARLERISYQGPCPHQIVVQNSKPSKG